jgi:hypothetical protein
MAAAAAAFAGSLPSAKNQEKRDDPRLASLKKVMAEMRAELKSLKKSMAGGRSGRLHAQFAKKARTYRSYHIAYGELQGLERTRIERSRPNNRPDEKEIAAVKQKYSVK